MKLPFVRHAAPRILACAIGLSLLTGCLPVGGPITEVIPMVNPTVATVPAQVSRVEMIERYRQHTVQVIATFAGGEMATSTAVVLAADDDRVWLLSTAHGIDGAVVINITTAENRTLTPARIVGVSACDDLIVLEATGVAGLSPAPFSERTEVATGETVSTIAHLGEPGDDLTATTGSVSNRQDQVGAYDKLFIIDAAVNPGHSGGPVIDSTGDVVGLVALRGGPDQQNVGYAITAQHALTVARELQSGKNLNWLGWVLQEFIEPGAALLFISAVQGGSPAARTKLQAGDVLLTLADTQVSTLADVCAILRSHTDGDILKLTVARSNGVTHTMWEGEIAIGSLEGIKPITPMEHPDDTMGGTVPLDDKLERFADTFDGDTGNWEQSSDDVGQSTIANGAYWLSLSQGNYWIVQTPQTVSPADTQLIASDVLLDGEGQAGLTARYVNEAGVKSFYACWIDTNSTYGCFLQLGNEYLELVPTEQSQAVQPDNWNTLVLTVEGDRLQFSVNGQVLAELSDSRLTGGVAGVYLESRDRAATVAFDNVEIFTRK